LYEKPISRVSFNAGVTLTIDAIPFRSITREIGWPVRGFSEMYS
jgi:hypothetical protein